VYTWYCREVKTERRGERGGWKMELKNVTDRMQKCERESPVAFKDICEKADRVATLLKEGHTFEAEKQFFLLQKYILSQPK